MPKPFMITASALKVHPCKHGLFLHLKKEIIDAVKDKGTKIIAYVKIPITAEHKLMIAAKSSIVSCWDVS